jgi:hypothetical protein
MRNEYMWDTTCKTVTTLFIWVEMMCVDKGVSTNWVTTQKNTIIIFNTMRTSNLTFATNVEEFKLHNTFISNMASNA